MAAFYQKEWFAAFLRELCNKQRNKQFAKALYIVNAVNFLRLANQKHISLVVKFVLSRCSLVTFVLHKVNIIQWYILQLTGRHKNKAGLTHAPIYYPFASTHMLNIQLPRVQNVHTKYFRYFCGFLHSRLLNCAWNSHKINASRILPLLQYEEKLTMETQKMLGSLGE